VLNFINSDVRWVRLTTLAVGLIAGAVIWEIVGWQFNPAIMVPLIGGEGHEGAAPRLYEYIFNDEEFRAAFVDSVTLFLTGFLIGVLTAVPLGILMARLTLMRVALETYILILYVTPMVALIPFILSIMGFDFWPKVLVVGLFTFFPVLYNTLEGARSVKPEYLEVARSFRTSEPAIWLDILIPYTLPFALTGIRQATGRALVGMVAAEFFLATGGLGEQIIVASRNFDMAGVLATIIVITVFGIVMMRATQALERRYAAWRGVG
jgi:ABC-type nitrate/sulfonate/bicarbonate transport system permease component